MADEADDVARPRLVDGLAFLPEQLVRGGQADRAAGALVGDQHISLELAGADPQERDAVTVLRIHISLDLEDKAGEAGSLDGHHGPLAGGSAGSGASAGARGRGHGVLKEPIEEELDAKVVYRAAEIDGRLPSGADRSKVEGVARAVEHRQLFRDLAVGVIVEPLTYQRVL